jgi:hypothetical protein
MKQRRRTKGNGDIEERGENDDERSQRRRKR